MGEQGHRGPPRLFISERPWLVESLMQRRPLILPDELYDWAVEWAYNIAATLRSTEHIVGVIVGLIDTVLMSLFADLLSSTLSYYSSRFGLGGALLKYLKGVG